jgi:hypothetical protein
MKPNSRPNKLHTCVFRTGYVLAATAGLLITASTFAFAQTPNDTHYPEAQEATPPQEMPMQMRGGMMMQDGMMGGMMRRGGGMMGMMENCPTMGGHTTAYAEGRIAFLKAELAITDAQKGAWEAYAAALKKNLDGMQAMRERMMKVMQAKSPVERLDAHLAAMENRITVLRELKPSLADLYAALSEDQKKKADQLLTGMGCMM